MTYEGLAARMTRAGCPINASALYKIEKADPPRRITVDELVSLRKVFEMELADLVVDPYIAASGKLRVLFEATLDAHDAASQAYDLLEETAATLRDYAKGQPETVERIETFLSSDPATLAAFHSYLSDKEES